MRLIARTHQLPVRLAVGSFVLNSGLSKLQNLEETAEQTHGLATTAYPFLKSQDPRDFTRLLGRTEVALGAALLVPLVPSLLAGRRSPPSPPAWRACTSGSRGCGGKAGCARRRPASRSPRTSGWWASAPLWSWTS